MSPRLEIPPAIDGHLDDPAWEGAARVEGFTQVEPFHGEPSPVATTLFIPEKRPFFLEGNERFARRIQQFYSRRIGNVDWGAKVAGTARL